MLFSYAQEYSPLAMFHKVPLFGSHKIMMESSVCYPACARMHEGVKQSLCPSVSQFVSPVKNVKRGEDGK